jgi:putative transposase
VNRGNRRECIFRNPEDYKGFLLLLRDAGLRFEISLFDYCVMPNHFHLIIRPDAPHALSAYMHWLTSTHVRRTHQRYSTVGQGHIYQERYRNVTLTSEMQFLNACRYVEANPVRAGLVERADLWPYSSCSLEQHSPRPSLAPWPIPRPDRWNDLVNSP